MLNHYFERIDYAYIKVLWRGTNRQSKFILLFFKAKAGSIGKEHSYAFTTIEHLKPTARKIIEQHVKLFLEEFDVELETFMYRKFVCLAIDCGFLRILGRRERIYRNSVGKIVVKFR